MSLTVKEIVAEYLRANGYDGLASGYNTRCRGCLPDDLFPCPGRGLGCKAGYISSVSEDDSCYIIVSRKPEGGDHE